MGLTNWFTQNWFEGIQTLGIFAGLVFTGFTFWKDERARKISNLIAINEQYQRTWSKLHEIPALARVLAKKVDLEREPISAGEELFVTALILNLSISFHAIKYGELVKFEGMTKDTREFFSLPIPKAVWKRVGRFQDGDFVRFVEEAVK